MYFCRGIFGGIEKRISEEGGIERRSARRHRDVMVTPELGDRENVTSLTLGSFLVLTFNIPLPITCNNKKNISF
jgi:hypothetical protein